MSDEFDNPKEFKICGVLGGLDLTRLVSTRARSFFVSAIEDVELIREYLAESTREQAYKGPFSSIEEMSRTLDWNARNLTSDLTTVDAGLGYSDDRPDRRMSRYQSRNSQVQPLVGDKQSDFHMIDAVSPLFPWLVDRKSPEDNWLQPHQNGQNEGLQKEPLFGSLYTAAWVVSYAGAVVYYPPMATEGGAKNMGDIVGGEYDPREEAFVVPTLPQQNPERRAVFTKPYPDTAIPGLSLITAAAPIYFTGNFQNYEYQDTYIGATGVDIAVSSVSSYLDVLQDTLVPRSFGILVDSSDLGTIVISQNVVNKLYPERTGLEDVRVTRSVDGEIVKDRRNQPYLPSDTILQELTKLDNADWKGLLETIQKVPPGDRSFTTMDIRLTGEKSATEYYIMFERWRYVADWTLLVFAPKDEVEKAIEVDVVGGAESLSMAGELGSILHGEGILENRGSLDVKVSARSVPDWIALDEDVRGVFTMGSGESRLIEFEVSTQNLAAGSLSAAIVFDVQDADYPDCFFREDLSLPLSLRLTPQNCGKTHKVPNLHGECVCNSHSFPVGNGCVTYMVLILAIILPIMTLTIIAVHLHGMIRKRRAEDSIWRLRMSDLKFDDPPKNIGGSFGLVLLGEYRGTQVAVKRMRVSGVVPSSGGHHQDLMNLNGSLHEFIDEETGEGLEQSRSAPSIANNNKSNIYGMLWLKKLTTRFPGVLGTGETTYKQSFIQEMRVLSKLRHPCIATIVGAVVDKNSEPMLLVMEHMEQGSLFDLIHNETMQFESEMFLSTLRDIAQGVQFLHNTEPQIIHGDLKSHNVLVDSRFRVKVAGFGTAIKRESGTSGAPYWVAPEVLRRESIATTASDVYSFGIILYEMYSRKEPYYGEDPRKVIREICDSSIQRRPPVPVNMNSRVSAIFDDCLLETPGERPSLHEIANRLKRFEPEHAAPIGLAETNDGPDKTTFGASMNKIPEHIAKALREGRTVAPEYHDCVTICVFDVVGDFVEELGEENAHDMLHRLFVRFDDLSEHHEVHRVETINGAWMGVTNCVKKQPDDHVKRIAEFAMDIMRVANETLIDPQDPDRGYAQLRIGFHSGPVLSNVIGSTNPRFGLFGDDVTTAFQMESTSLPGRIQCSIDAGTLLEQQAPEIHLYRRGSIPVKGKGDMTTFFVSPNAHDLII